jgi:ketosteroid isomerase-like protein
MHPSPELENIVRQLYEKEASGGMLEFARRFYSRREGVLLVGTDPAERFGDYKTILRFYKANAAAGLDININDLEAHCEGSVGWVVDLVTASLPNGNKIPVRHTYVFHKENNEWKIIHTHISIPVPNESIGA